MNFLEKFIKIDGMTVFLREIRFSKSGLSSQRSNMIISNKKNNFESENSSQKDNTNYKNESENYFLWLHGWGLNSLSFVDLLKQFENTNSVHFLIDLPGFGQSKSPEEIWGSHKYALFVIKIINSEINHSVFIIGHSFGCRIAMQISYISPKIVSKLILIAAPGLPYKKSLFFYLKKIIGTTGGKFLKLCDLFFKINLREKLIGKVGSTDYRLARGIMREILVKVARESLREIAKKLETDAIFFYGEKDTETPVEIGKKYHKLIKNSKLFAIKNFDHITILSFGSYQIKNYLKDMNVL